MTLGTPCQRLFLSLSTGLTLFSPGTSTPSVAHFACRKMAMAQAATQGVSPWIQRMAKQNENPQSQFPRGGEDSDWPSVHQRPISGTNKCGQGQGLTEFLVNQTTFWEKDGKPTRPTTQRQTNRKQYSQQGMQNSQQKSTKGGVGGLSYIGKLYKLNENIRTMSLQALKMTSSIQGEKDQKLRRN